MLALALTAPPASAVNLSIGENLAKLKDVSDTWINPDGDFSTPSIVKPTGMDGVPPGPGHENRTLFKVMTILDKGDAVVFDTSDPTELTGLLYDLVLVGPPIPSGSGFILDFVPYGRNALLVDADGDSTGALDPTDGHLITFGGVLEMYEDAAKDYTQDPGGVGAWDALLPAAVPPGLPHGGPASGEGPYFWTEGASGVGHVGAAGADTFLGATEGTYWLSAALVELQYLANIGVIIDPALIAGGIPLTPGTVLREFIDLTAGTGHGFAYANIFGGAMAPIFERGIAGPLADMAILFDINTPIFAAGTLSDTLVYQGIGYWPVDSEDPVVFSIIPEPMTLSLLGLSLLGLAGIRLRRKK